LARLRQLSLSGQVNVAVFREKAVGRYYAGVLGSLAFAAVIARGLVHACGLESTTRMAMAFLFLFAGIGWIAGRIAQAAVQQSVQSTLPGAVDDDPSNHLPPVDSTLPADAGS
jgi:hypothetical protein